MASHVSRPAGIEHPSVPAPKPGRRARIKGALVGLPSKSRELISRHQKERKSRDLAVSTRSRRGLDWTNFFLADVQMGFGSFLSFYLATLGWSKEDVGLALSVGSLAAILSLVPAGALLDAARSKRRLVA